jgi:hypothetical protein
MDQQTTLLILSADAVPAPLADWLQAQSTDAVLVSIERLPDGRLVLQALPDVDPRLVAQVRRVMGQHADVLRRLT